MYAPIERRQLHGLPLGFEKLEWLEKRLKRLNANYQLIYSRRMFDVAFMEEFQFALVRWENNPYEWERKRHLVLETTDLEQMESALFMLINTEEEDANNKH
jgi:hypothetical protein